MKKATILLALFGMTLGCKAQELPKEYKNDASAGYYISDKKGATKIAVTGGSGSHDFLKYFGVKDGKILSQNGINTVVFTQDPMEMDLLIPVVDVLMLTNNQPLNSTSKEAIFSKVNSGKLNLLIYHPSTWYNWKDWPEYNKELVGGGSRSHEKIQEFEVTVVKTGHPLMKGVPSKFKIVDELYRWEKDPDAEIEVLAMARGIESGEEYPCIWIVKHSKAKIIGNTLGHDARAHDHEAYKAILENSVEWISQK